MPRTSQTFRGLFRFSRAGRAGAANLRVLALQFHLRIPAGTKVVVRSSHRVGVVVEAPPDPDQAYRVQFPDSSQECYLRPELSIFRQDQADFPPLADHNELRRFVLFRCVVGSRAYGLDRADSDTDRRGFFLPPAEWHWSLGGVPEQVENSEAQECYWEIEKFLRLALKGNPTVLECLYSPLVEHATPLAQELLAIRDIFLSRHLHQTYNGYVLSQFKRLEQDLRNKGELRWKHVMHLIRMLLSGIAALEQGTVPLRVKQHRDRLLAIRNGEMSWDEADAWRLALHIRFDEALARTKLPEHPDFERANEFLIQARRLAADPAYAAEPR